MGQWLDFCLQTFLWTYFPQKLKNVISGLCLLKARHKIRGCVEIIVLWQRLYFTIIIILSFFISKCLPQRCLKIIGNRQIHQISKHSSKLSYKFVCNCIDTAVLLYRFYIFKLPCSHSSSSPHYFLSLSIIEIVCCSKRW